VSSSHSHLLGSLLGDCACTSAVLADKLEALRRLGDWLSFLSAHDALILLLNCFALPKLMHVLRTAPCFLSSILESYDNLQREILSSNTNTHLDAGGSAWTQATLPVRLGGLGIRSAVEVALSAYLASVHSSSKLVNAILPSSPRSLSAAIKDEARSCWSRGHDLPPPEVTATCKQRLWDSVRAALVAIHLLEGAANDEECDRLLSVSTKESGAWLKILPMSAQGLRMDDRTVRVAVSMRLGTAVCGPQFCQWCGAVVDTLGRHALSSQKNASIMQQSMTSLNCIAVLGSTGYQLALFVGFICCTFFI